MVEDAQVAQILEILVAGVKEALGDNLVGIYLRGSLALGDFIPETSDVDLLVATESEITPEEFERLEAMHWRVARSGHPFAKRIEIAYIDGISLRRFEHDRRFPSLGQGEDLDWVKHGENWVLERWAVREHGVVLFGPSPETVIDPISRHELETAVRNRLQDWIEWASSLPDEDWPQHRGHQAYVVETMCRVRAALLGHGVVSKRSAVRMALETLPEPWRSTVVRSQEWRTDGTHDASIVPEVRAFVLWTGSQAGA